MGPQPSENDLRNAPTAVLLKTAEDMVWKHTSQSRLFQSPLLLQNEAKLPTFSRAGKFSAVYYFVESVRVAQALS